VTASALHRVGQFWRHASARVTPGERATAEMVLGPGLAPLFLQLPVNDQRHGLDVLDTVTRLDGQPSPLLQQAALLHDVGKGGARFSVVDRSLTVFLEAVAPRILRSMLAARPAFARRFATYRDHARIGAEVSYVGNGSTGRRDLDAKTACDLVSLQRHGCRVQPEGGRRLWGAWSALTR